MAHISLPEGLPGIRGPMAFRPETAKPLNELVDVLLRGPHTLSPGERELIATFVSARNDCRYCAIGDPLNGRLFDLFGGYRPLFLMLSTYTALAFVAVLLVPRGAGEACTGPDRTASGEL